LTSAAWTVPSRAFRPNGEAAEPATGARQRIGEVLGQNAWRALQPRTGDRDRHAVQEQLARGGKQARIERLPSARDDPLAHSGRQVGLRSRHAAASSFST
jgi:hypothetical protein